MYSPGEIESVQSGSHDWPRLLTGESTPVTKKTGGKVIGGSINGEGSLTIEVKGTGKDSFLSQVIDLVKQAQQSKSKTQNLANTAAMWLTIIALGSGAITFLLWLTLMSRDFAFAIERSVTVMVIDGRNIHYETPCRRAQISRIGDEIETQCEG